MEDGKKRHLFQLEAQRQQINKTIPDERLNEHLEYMRQIIKGYSFPESIFKCCLKKKYKRVNPDFCQAFEQLPTSDQLYYYRKYLQCSLAISKKTTKFPQTAQYLEDHNIKEELIKLQYRYEASQPWRSVTAKLDPQSKTIDSPDFNIDLHRTFLDNSSSSGDRSMIVVIPWDSKLRAMEIRSEKQEENIQFQRIDLIWYAALEQNIVQIIEGLEQVKLVQNQNGLESERSLEQRLNRQNSEPNTAHTPQLHTFKQVRLSNYLTYNHPQQSFPAPVAPNRLRTDSNVHYFFQKEYQIGNDGEMVVINKQKMEAQGAVIKYLIKRIFSGGSIFSISLPVTVFGQDSNLSLLISSYRHAAIDLDAAALEKNAMDRYLKVIRFALTCPSGYVRCDKPFNPILGETYQALVEGTLFYGQQISHHPPVSAVYIKGRGYTMYGSLEAEVVFGLNSAVGNNKGWLNISFDQEDIRKKVVKFNNIPGQMTGMVIGSRKLNLKGVMYIIDEENYLYCKMTIGQIKIQKKVKCYKDSVEGMVVKLKKRTDLTRVELISQNDVESQLGLVSGRWLSDVYYNGIQLINTLKEDLPEVQQYPALLPSDYSLRQDIIMKRRGNDEASQQAKERLEQLQRHDRKLREKETYRKSIT